MSGRIIDAARNNGPPADRLIGQYFRTRRYAGSKDRRAVRELVYRAIRACGPVPATGRAAMLRLAERDAEVAASFTGEGHGAPPIADDEDIASGGLAPEWLADTLAKSGIDGREADALLDRAPLDIRVNGLKASRANADAAHRGGRMRAAVRPAPARRDAGGTMGRLSRRP